MYWVLLKLFWGFIFSHLIWRSISYFLCIFFTIDRIIASWVWFYERAGCCNERYKKWLLVLGHKVRSEKEMMEREQIDKIHFVDLNRQLQHCHIQCFCARFKTFLYFTTDQLFCKFFFFILVLYKFFAINLSSFLPWHPFLICCRSHLAYWYYSFFWTVVGVLTVDKL